MTSSQGTERVTDRGWRRIEAMREALESVAVCDEAWVSVLSGLKMRLAGVHQIHHLLVTAALESDGARLQLRLISDEGDAGTVRRVELVVLSAPMNIPAVEHVAPPAGQ